MRLGPIVLNNTGDASEREEPRANPEVINQFAIDIDIRNYLRVVKGRGQMPLIGLAAVWAPVRETGDDMPVSEQPSALFAWLGERNQTHPSTL